MKTAINIGSILAMIFSGVPSSNGKDNADAHPSAHHSPGPPGVVKSVNGLTGHLRLTGGSNVTVARVGNGFRIDAHPSGSDDDGQEWSRAGNVAAPGEFLGTLNDVPLELKVNGQRALRLEPTLNTPNVIGGFAGNSAGPAVAGVTLAGGGSADQGPNRIEASFGTISGGAGNVVGGGSGSIGGGSGNRIGENSWSATIGGGYLNVIQPNAFNASIAGGAVNQVASYAASAVIGGGEQNWIQTNSMAATIGGGRENLIGSLVEDGTISGGYFNQIQQLASGATIGGGANNIVGPQAHYSAIAGGNGNQAQGFGATVGGGRGNLIGPTAQDATIPGGIGNECAGPFSFAAGTRARALHRGSFVWADYQPDSFTIASTVENQFTARASGGVRFVSSPFGLTGVELAPGAGAWSALSDRNVKENFERTDAKEILDRVAQLPIQTWNMKTQNPSIRHIGPMAQDFHAAFGVGEDDKHISTVDADGVALAAIQGLVEVVKEKDTRISTLEQRVADLEKLTRSWVRQGMNAAGR